MRSQVFLSVVMTTAAAGLATSCFADVVIADSAAEFSGTQGQDHWYYGFYDGDGTVPFSTSDFEQLPAYGTGLFANNYWFTGNDDAGGFWTNIAAVVMHPNGPISSGGRQNVLHWSVRRWVSEVAGSVTISGNVSDAFGGDGDGVIGRIIINGSELYSATINDGDSVGANFNFATLVSVGSLIDFAVDPRSNDFRDHTPFTATITTAVPEPSAFALCCIAGLAVITCQSRLSRGFRSAHIRGLQYPTTSG